MAKKQEIRKKENQGFIKGAAILGASMIVTKIIGAIFKIPLAQILGGTGMGYFNTAYMLFTPVLAVSSAGLPVAMSKMVASYNAKGEYNAVKKLFRICLFFFLFLGISGMLMILFLAENFVKTVENPNAYLSVIAIAPSVFFGCMMSAYRGYNEGHKNMIPTAVSQVTEGIVKLLAGLFSAQIIINIGIRQYAETGKVFSRYAGTLSEAQALTLPYAAAAAVAGVSFSTFAGFIYLFLKRRLTYKNELQENKNTGGHILPESIEKRNIRSLPILKELIKIAVPVTIGALAANLTSLIDLISIMNRLTLAFNNNYSEMIDRFGGLLPGEVNTIQDMSNFIYGSYSGFAVTIFHLVPALTAVLGKSALPAISEAECKGDKKAVYDNSKSLIRLAVLVGVPSGIGISFMSKPILSLLFSSRPAEAAIAAPLLAVMGIGIAAIAVAAPLFSLLQAFGRTDLPVKLIIIGGIIKVIFNFSLISNPRINIMGAALGTTFCYVIIFILTIYNVVKIINVSITDLLLSPLFSSIICGISAKLIYSFLERTSLNEKISIVFSIGTGFICFIFCLFLTGGIKTGDINKIFEKKCTKLKKHLKNFTVWFTI